MFTGFTDETVDFMWGIRFNNERTWFEAHKETYLTQFYQPMRELGDELLKLQGDTGGRQVWKRHALEGGLVEVETERELEDVDVLPLP